MQQIAEKDDRNAQQQQLTMAYVGQQLAKVLEKLESIEAQTTKARGASA